MPDVVSQWTAKTWLIALSSASILSSRARSGGVSSGVSSDAVGAAGDLGDLHAPAGRRRR